MLSKIEKEIETLLFMAKNPLQIADIQEVLGCDQAQILEAIKNLEHHYNDHGIQLIEVAHGLQLVTRKEYAPIVDRLVHSPVEVSLTPASMESLAIIAYKQPCSKSEIESIRGVNSDAVIKSLLDKGLIEELGKSDALGKPTVYGTTLEFLKHFGLKDLSGLLPLQEVQSKPEGVKA